ncbi:MAG: ribosome small subunit-dependent GTPase A [Phycisphaerae bacterium]
MARDPSKKPKKKYGKKIRVDLRKNREKATRDKSQWTRHHRDESVKSDDAVKSETVRAKGDLSRKRTIIEEAGESDASQLRDGIVVRMRGLIAEVDDGETVWACTVRRMLRTRLISERHPVTVGDCVRFLPVEQGGEQSRQVSEELNLPEGVIEQVAPRTTTLVRQYDRRQQAVAANIDIVLIVVSANNPTLRPHLIDRYLVAAHQGGMRPVVCINKADLDENGAAAAVAERYRGIGYESLLTSTVDARGLDALRATLRDKTSVLVGPSGSGKSSILNALDETLTLRVGSLTDLQRGRHTTTTASLLRWAFGGHVVDTPGMRQFDLTEIEPDELEAYFLEFVDLVADCRFPDCSHTHESDCAIKTAVESGGISYERYDSYCKMYEECREKQDEQY